MHSNRLQEPKLIRKRIPRSKDENVREESMFQINCRNDLTTRRVIRYRGELWDITRIDDYEGRKEDLKVYYKRKS